MNDIPLAQPDTGPEELAALAAVLASRRLSIGPVLDAFESKFAKVCGVPEAVAVSSGTAGLQLALDALGLDRGDEVITVAFTFIATANVLLHAGVRPVFVDIDAETLNVDPQAIDAAVNERTRAILVVHVFGRPAPMDDILEVARRHGLAVIEDACEALGARYRGLPVGTLGDVGVYGFYPNKIITTGEGGMLVSRDPSLLDQCRRLRNQGRDPGSEVFDPERPGYNFRLSELHAALGVVQLGRLPGFLERRQQLAEEYDTLLSSFPDITTPATRVHDMTLSWFVYVIRLSTGFDAAMRDEIVSSLRASGVGCGRYFPAIHLLDLYRKRFSHADGDLPVTESVASRTIALPFFNALKRDQQQRVAACLTDAIDRVKKAS